MIKSMTGFGRINANFEDKQLNVEIKTLNSKQFDCKIKLPSVYSEKEGELRSILANKLGRGRIDMNISIDFPNVNTNYRINEDIFLSYYEQLKNITKKIETNNSTDFISIITRLPEVISTSKNTLDNNEWTLLTELVDKAIVETDKFRIIEGVVMAEDIKQRINTLLTFLKDVESYESERMPTIKERILKTFTEVNEKIQIDKNRFEQELIYYLEKLDISEEKTRLLSHLNYFLSILEESESQGRKLGFIAQEIGREINTIGSKANDANIQQIIVQMKDELEKIKEQLMNIL